MPTYDLVCDACEHDFEAYRQGFLRDEDRVCPNCGNDDARQLFTGFVTARPLRVAPAAPPQPASGGGCCGGICGGH